MPPKYWVNRLNPLDCFFLQEWNKEKYNATEKVPVEIVAVKGFPIKVSIKATKDTQIIMKVVEKYLLDLYFLSYCVHTFS